MATRAAIQQRNRQALITATIDLVAELGYRAATVEAIAANAGLSTGAVYSVFGGKHAMFYAAITHCRDGLPLKTALDLPPELPVAEVLRRFATAMARAATSAGARRAYAFELELAVLVLHDSPLRERLRADGDPVVDSLAAALTGRAHPREPLPEHAAQRLAVAAAAQVRGIIQRSLTHDIPIDTRLLTDSCAALATLPVTTNAGPP